MSTTTTKKKREKEENSIQPHSSGLRFCGFMIFLWLDDGGIKSCDKMSVVVDGNEQMGKSALKMVLGN